MSHRVLPFAALALLAACDSTVPGDAQPLPQAPTPAEVAGAAIPRVRTRPPTSAPTARSSVQNTPRRSRTAARAGAGRLSTSTAIASA